MRRVKRRTFSGAVCEQEVYTVADRVQDIRHAKPSRPRFLTEEEREQHKLGISRRRHARIFNRNFSPTSCYSTLTLDDEHEVHTFSEAKHLINNYVRPLQRACPDARIMIYLGRGKSTHRIHAHMVSEGVPEEVIHEKWGLGSVQRVVHLREHNYYNGVDHGCDYTGLANYLFDHWTPEQGGHRWKQTSNMLAPEVEPAREAVREYTESHPPAAPKGYRLVETRATKYGYLYFKYVKIPEPRRRGKG